MTINSDTACLPLFRSELRLPTVARLWGTIGETAVSRVCTPHARLPALLDHEVAERANRRIARHLADARLPLGKTFDTFDFAGHANGQPCPYQRARDSWLDTGTSILLFGPPGVGKTHLSAELGHALVEAGHRVLFARTTDLVQQLQTARQELRVAAAIEKLDKYRLLILDDLSYVRKSQAETSVLFDLIGARYERCSILITANQPLGAWDDIFPDPAMTVAAIDRLIHHPIIEMNTASYRRKAAQARGPDP